MRFQHSPGRWRGRGHSLGAGVSLIALALLASAGPAIAQTDTEDAQAGPTAVAEDDTATDETIIITGRRAAIESAIRRKENSDAIIDSIVADDAGKLPDNSITEVLQRVPGVAIVRFASLGDPDHFSVEGSGIQVRGLSGVASRLNGREIFGANGGRSLTWGDVTPELMAAVDVYKSATADLIEGGTGGQIDLRTKMPFDYSKPSINAELGVSYGDMAEKTDYNGSILLTDRWDTPIGEIGVLVDVAYSRLTTLSSFFRMEPYYEVPIGGESYFLPGGFDYGDEYFQRKRTGIYGALQWAPSDDLTFYGIFFQSRYRNKAVEHGAFVVTQTPGVDPATSEFDEFNGLISTDSLFNRTGDTIGTGGVAGISRGRTVTRDISGGFRWDGDSPLSIQGAIQHVDSKAKVDRYAVFRDINYPGTFGLDLSGDLPEVILPSGAQDTFDNPANYLWSATMPHNEDNHGKMLAGNLDLEYEFDDGGFFKSVKVGGRLARRTERDLNNGFNWAALGRGWNGCDEQGQNCDPQLTFADARPGDVEQYFFPEFFHGDVTVPGKTLFPSYKMITAMDRLGDHAYYGGPDIRQPGFILPNDITDYKTTTQAAYALVRFGREPGDGSLGFNGNVGVRVVKTKNSSEGFFTQSTTTFVRDGTTYELAERAAVREGGREFTRVLPNVNLTLLPTPEFRIRGAYNITMDNASFFALRAQGSLGVATETQGEGETPLFLRFTANTGNPALLPTMSNNLDLSFEWYPKNGTLLHFALFHKRIKNLPIYTSTQREIEVFYTEPEVMSRIEVAEAVDIANATEKATVKGFEIGGKTFFDMLPGFLSGFGVDMNYTYIDSSNPGDRYLDIFGTERHDLPVQGLSKHNFNATLLYEKNWLSARLAYSWRSKYLQTTTGNGTSGDYPNPDGGTNVDISLPIYGASYGTLDAGVRFKLNDHVALSIEASNILNATAKTLMGGYEGDTRYVRSWFQNDRRVSAAVSISF